MGRPAKTEQAPPDGLDPLADLRGADDQEAPPVPGNGETPEGEAEAVYELRPMVSEEMHDQMVSEVVAAWHNDPTSQGFLHGGGPCGCRFIARLALSTAVPVMTEEDMAPHDLEPPA